MRSLGIMAAVFLLGSGGANAQALPSVGRTLHYERTNIDGSEPEQVYMHRAAPDRIEVYKMVERCTRAAIVTATIDPHTGEASHFSAARLMPDAQRDDYATLDDQGGPLVLALTKIDDAPRHPDAHVLTRPWHLYDYDLATLSAAFEARGGSRRDYRFGMAMFWEYPDKPDQLVHWLGDAIAHFAGEERHLDHDTLRFEVAGSALGPGGGGPLWIDAGEGYLVDAQFQRPNHDTYRDFRLRLIGAEPGGEAAWTALLKRHYEGCPASTNAP